MNRKVVIVLAACTMLITQLSGGLTSTQAEGAAVAVVGCGAVTVTAATDTGSLTIIATPVGSVSALVFKTVSVSSTMPITLLLSYSTVLPNGTPVRIRVSDLTQTLIDTVQNCTQSIAGPSIPANFVQRTILCDVPVYDSPGGHPVGENRIKNQQRWYVDPSSTLDSARNKWTAIFVASYNLAYIPTRCVGKN